MDKPKQSEPWLRGTLTDVPPLQRAILHALELAKEDLERWCGELSDEELYARPCDIAPVAFHVRHVARSMDRLLSYAEGTALSSGQIAQMKSELDPGATGEEIFAELNQAMEVSASRIRSFSPEALAETRNCWPPANAYHRRWSADPRRRSHPAPRWPGDHDSKNFEGDALLSLAAESNSE